jgi:hypothetical protein
METAKGFWKNCLLMRDIKKYKPMTFCIEDGEGTTQRELDMYQDFLKSMFPEKSEFEI